MFQILMKIPSETNNLSHNYNLCYIKSSNKMGFQKTLVLLSIFLTTIWNTHSDFKSENDYCLLHVQCYRKKQHQKSFWKRKRIIDWNKESQNKTARENAQTNRAIKLNFVHLLASIEQKQVVRVEYQSTKSMCIRFP